MSYLLKQSTKDVLIKSDLGSPNRTLIIANAYAFASLLLADVVSQETKKAYLQEANFWIRNEFDADKLFRPKDGVFIEHFGYDTGYHAVALWFAIRHALYFPNSIPNAEDKFVKAARWLEKRILSDGTIDCTYNTRSGPNNARGDIKNTDLNAVKRALLYVGAIQKSPSAFDAARRAAGSINGLPPVVFSLAEAKGRVGTPFSFEVMATNAGLQALDSGFSISAANLPNWLSVAPGSVVFNKSTGSRTLAGTPTAAGTYKILLTARNVYGASSSTELVVTIE